MDLRSILDAVDRLPPEELEQLRQHIEQRQTIVQLVVKDETVDERLAMIFGALADIREGLTEEELQEMVDAMNYEYIEPEDSELFGSFDDPSENGS